MPLTGDTPGSGVYGRNGHSSPIRPGVQLRKRTSTIIKRPGSAAALRRRERAREVLSPEPMPASRVFRRFIQLDVTDDGRPVEISAQNIVPMVTIGSYGPRGTSRKTTASPPGNHIAGVFVAARHAA